MEEHNLALWCMAQAKAYKEGRLTDEQIKKLNEIKFPFEKYIQMAKEYESFLKYQESGRVEMTKREFEEGEVYNQIKVNGYGIVDDLIFIEFKEFFRLTQDYRLTKEEVQSILKSQRVLSIEVI